MRILLIISAIFYSILCIFSIVTGIIYFLGKKLIKNCKTRADSLMVLAGREK